jgi:hypothetical protein
MTSDSPKLNRRQAMKLVAAAAATISILDRQTFGAGPTVAQPYGRDALLTKIYQPGDFWPLTFTREQKLTAKALADLILPADDQSPAASEVGAVEFVDEWISAPYATQQGDRKEVLEGFVWLDAESRKRYSKEFAALRTEQQTAIADDISLLGKSKPEHQQGERFFAKFRNLVAGAYYATQKGWKDVGYVGNVPLLKFTGPPKEVRDRLGV